MKKAYLLFITATLSLIGCNANLSEEPNELIIATWNLEHLATDANTGCKPRTEADHRDLERYAKTVNADIFALQEVASKDAIAHIFNSQDWQIVMSSRADSPSYSCYKTGAPSTQQKVAFAVKKPVKINTVKHLTALSQVKQGAREGLQVSINYNHQTINLLNLHLKSGCFVEDYRHSDRDSCQVFAKQVTILKHHISQQQETDNLILLGDFNHRLANPSNHFRSQLLALDKANITVLTDDKTSCHPKYPAPIDHIITSSHMMNKLSTETVKFHQYNNNESNTMLSDHCALSATFNF